MMGGSFMADIPQLGVEVLKLQTGVSVEKAISTGKGLGVLEYVEPNYIVTADYVPNDPMYSKQYSHVRTSSALGWDLTLGSDKIKVAIVDTGVDYNHPDLSGKVTKGKDFVNNDSDPMDDEGHGTHCAGVAAAKTNNGVGVAGMGFNVSLIAEKVLDSGGSGSLDAVAKGIIDAADLKADVISLSLGGPSDVQVLHDAVEYAWKKGAVVVAAAGNNGDTVKHYPGAYETVIAVGASDQNDKRADFSTYGDWVDVAAPGVDIISTLPNNQYGEESGTSMACPMVAGLVALMKSYNPETTNVELRAALESNCDNVGNWILKGRINAFRAVNSVLRPVEYTFNAKDISVYSNQGTGLSGSASFLSQADTGKVTLRSILQRGVGSVAALSTTLIFDKDVTKMRSGSFTVKTQALRGVTLQLFLYNFDSGKYDLVKAFSASGNSDTIQIPVTGMTHYVSGSQIKTILRGFLGNTRSATAPAYTMTTDVLKLVGKFSPR